MQSLITQTFEDTLELYLPVDIDNNIFDFNNGVDILGNISVEYPNSKYAMGEIVQAKFVYQTGLMETPREIHFDVIGFYGGGRLFVSALPLKKYKLNLSVPYSLNKPGFINALMGKHMVEII